MRFWSLQQKSPQLTLFCLDMGKKHNIPIFPPVPEVNWKHFRAKYGLGAPYDSHPFIILNNNKKALQLLMAWAKACSLKETATGFRASHDKRPRKRNSPHHFVVFGFVLTFTIVAIVGFTILGHSFWSLMMVYVFHKSLMNTAKRTKNVELYENKLLWWNHAINLNFLT